MYEIIENINLKLDDTLQSLDILENILPAPTMNPNQFGKFDKDELMKLIDKAGEYQQLVDTLMTHPALIYLKKETASNL